MKLELKFTHFRSGKCVWKCRLQRCQPFCPWGRWVKFHLKFHQIMPYPGAKLITDAMHGTLFHEMDHKMKLFSSTKPLISFSAWEISVKPNKMTEMLQNIFHNYAMICQDVDMRNDVKTSPRHISNISTNANHWKVRLRFTLTMNRHWFPLCLLAYPMSVTPKPRELGNISMLLIDSYR